MALQCVSMYLCGQAETETRRSCIATHPSEGGIPHEIFHVGSFSAQSLVASMRFPRGRSSVGTRNPWNHHHCPCLAYPVEGEPESRLANDISVHGAQQRQSDDGATNHKKKLFWTHFCAHHEKSTQQHDNNKPRTKETVTKMTMACVGLLGARFRSFVRVVPSAIRFSAVLASTRLSMCRPMSYTC